jgi:hypothetical protein
MLHVKHFCPIETKIPTKPHTSVGLKYVGLRGGAVVLAIDGQPIVAKLHRGRRGTPNDGYTVPILLFEMASPNWPALSTLCPVPVSPQTRETMACSNRGGFSVEKCRADISRQIGGAKFCVRAAGIEQAAA